MIFFIHYQRTKLFLLTLEIWYSNCLGHTYDYSLWAIFSPFAVTWSSSPKASISFHIDIHDKDSTTIRYIYTTHAIHYVCQTLYTSAYSRRCYMTSPPNVTLTLLRGVRSSVWSMIAQLASSTYRTETYTSTVPTTPSMEIGTLLYKLHKCNDVWNINHMWCDCSNF